MSPAITLALILGSLGSLMIFVVLLAITLILHTMVGAQDDRAHETNKQLERIADALEQIKTK